MDVLQKNLFELNKRYDDFEFPEDLSNEGDLYSMCESKDGSINMICTEDGKTQYIHSKYDPVSEGKKIAAQYKSKIEQNNVIILFGIGMGYVLKELLDISNPGNMIIAYEPSWYIFRKAMENQDLSDVLSNPRLSLLVGKNTDVYSLCIDTYLNSENYFNVVYIASAYHKNKYIKEYKAFSEAIFEKIKRERVLYDTFWSWGTIWTENPILNLKYIMKDNMYNDTFDMFNGKPVIVVAAGPSLDKNIHLLKQAEGKIPIICAYTAYKVLLRHNIKPDFVATVDAGQSKHENEEDKKQTYDAALIYLAVSEPALVERFKGKRIFAYTSHYDILKSILPQKEKAIDAIYASGSVTISAIHAALYMGASSVIFMGYDLAISDKSHATGTVFDYDSNKHIEEIHLNKDAVWVEGINGGEVKTTFLLNEYLETTEFLIKSNPGAKFIDATEGGALKKGTVVETFENVLEQYRESYFDVYGAIDKALNKPRYYDIFDVDIIKENILRQLRLLKSFKEVLDEGRSVLNKYLSTVVYGNLNDFNLDKAKKEMSYYDEKLNEIIDQTTLFLNMNDRIKFKLRAHQPHSEVNPQIYYLRHSIILYDEFIECSDKILSALTNLGKYINDNEDALKTEDDNTFLLSL